MKSIYFTEIKFQESSNSELIQQKFNVVAENKHYVVIDDHEFTRLKKFNNYRIFDYDKSKISVVFFKSIIEKKKCINIKCYHSDALNKKHLEEIKTELINKIEDEVYYFKGLKMLIDSNFEEWTRIL